MPSRRGARALAGRSRMAWVVPGVLGLHLLAWWMVPAPRSRNALRPEVRWIESRLLPRAGTPAAVPPVARPSSLPSPTSSASSTSRASRPPRVSPAGPGAGGEVPATARDPDRANAISVSPAAPPAAVPLPPAGAAAPPAALDLDPEALGPTLRQARDASGGQRRAQRWPEASTDRPAPVDGPARMTESVGASGSRVTRVESRWGAYCIRGPMPGRPDRPGAAPEPSLPTNCP